jgi:hypothetical protein
MGLAIHRSKDKVVDLQASSLERRAPLRSLLKLDNHLSYNTCLGSINGLGGQRHHRPECGYSYGHLGVLGCRKA